MFGGFVGFAYLCRLMKPTNDLNIRKSIAILVLAATFAACSGDSTDTPANGYNDGPTNPSGEAEEIRVNADVFQMMDGTRTTTFDNDDAIQTEGSFFCTAYDAGTTTVNTTSNVNSYVDWTVSTSSWAFRDGKHNWPGTGDLDFFAYMPAPRPSYIAADPTFTAAHNVTFTCSSLPMEYSSATSTEEQGSNLKEFMFGMALGQNRDNAGTGVSLQFQHPFARIRLQLAASHPNITINSITFRSIKNNGNYDHIASPKWSTTGDATDFVLSLTGDDAVFDDNTASPKPIGPDFIMIPQNWTGEIVVNADCLYWGEKENFPSLTTTIPTSWQPGHSYTYTFNISPYELIVDISKYTEQW